MHNLNSKFCGFIPKIVQFRVKNTIFSKTRAIYKFVKRLYIQLLCTVFQFMINDELLGLWNQCNNAQWAENVCSRSFCPGWLDGIWITMGTFIRQCYCCSSHQHPSLYQPITLGASINHVVKILGIFDPFPPSWSLLLNKAYVLKWLFG